MQQTELLSVSLPVKRDLARLVEVIGAIRVELQAKFFSLPQGKTFFVNYPKM